MWTSTALASELRPYAGTVWRVVEAQHRISTNRLAANRAEQAVLEALADEVKPQLPHSARRLDWLLAAPFRYGHGQPSRFRAANERPGLFYASESEATAIAETAYWRLRFFSRSPGFAPPMTTTEHSSFTAAVATDHALDLTLAPLSADETVWTDPDDYGPCQALAREARDAGTALLRTISARDAMRGCNIVVLDPLAFAEVTPRSQRTWHFRFEGGRLTAFAAFPSDDRFEFTYAEFGLGKLNG
jgi:hypothetical protein